MRQIFLLFFATLVSCFTVFGKYFHLKPSTHHTTVSFLLTPQQQKIAAAEKTTSVLMQRVIAQSKRDSVTGPLSDSVNLKYGLFRNSTYDYNDMLYPYNYTYNITPMFNFAGTFKKPQVLADTYQHWTLNPNTMIYGKFESTYSNYDSHKNLTNFNDAFVDSVTNKNTSYVNTFDTGGRIISGKWFVSIGGVMDSSYKQFFSYNTAFQLIKDSIYEYHAGNWHLVAKTFYTYDISSNLTQIDCFGNLTDTTFDSVLLEQMQYVNTYDASHRLTTVATNIFDGTSLSPSVKDTFAYTGIHPFHTSWREYQYDNINHYWAPMFNMFKHINTFGYPDTVNINGFDSLLNNWIPQTLEVVRYDTFNNPDTLFEYDYNWSSFPLFPNYTTKYYYNIYNDNTCSPDKEPASDAFVVYPNPVKNELVISNSNNNKPRNLTFSVIDISGRVVITKNSGSYMNVESIPLAGISTGSYVLLIQNDTGNILHRQMVIKE